MYPQLPGAERCPPEMQKLISWCWVDDPKDRPTTRRVLKILNSLGKQKTTKIKEGSAGKEITGALVMLSMHLHQHSRSRSLSSLRHTQGRSPITPGAARKGKRKGKGTLELWDVHKGKRSVEAYRRTANLLLLDSVFHDHKTLNSFFLFLFVTLWSSFGLKRSKGF